MVNAVLLLLLLLFQIVNIRSLFLINEQRREKTSIRGFRPGPTQARLYSLRRWEEPWDFGFRKKRDYTIYVAKTKAITSCCEVTVQLICAFVFRKQVSS